MQCLDGNHHNDIFCQLMILFINPNETPEDEVALVCDPSGAGIMMEWEWPISMFFPPVLVPFNLFCDQMVSLLTIIIIL
jgi:hypothetical protein